MAATWWLIFFQLVFRIPSKPGIGFRGLRVYDYCPFSCETENEAAAAILVLLILINRSYLQLIALKPGIYRVTASAEGYLSACTVFLTTVLEPYQPT